MANYSVNVTDNGNGTFSIGAVLRNPTTVASGGTNLNTTTAGSGFQQAATTTADGLGHTLMSPSEVLERCKAIIADDRAYNG